ncbi:hypothetical protein SUGI_0068390 [Cryptomeria japonica]|uniref:protein NRT1/ PTR FAMILY 4.4 n=1 Tax=Cryptomeria japonica TaxID=3369 RepID=UPI002408D98B|nr:protein NRT1/ PTR FAMILY 4.4 [Cryptomeria japonica]GLJ07500.1 hypothetical protein SUGI_0068390 [Cryptomeria japonica]
MAEGENGWHERNNMVSTKEEDSGHGGKLDFVDRKGRPCNSDKLGGVKAAAFVLVAQGFDAMALIAVQNNLIRYLYSDMHFSVSESANAVTNFVGTANLLSLAGGLLSDSFLTRFKTMSIFSVVEMMGYFLLTAQAYLPSLKPPRCSMDSFRNNCQAAHGVQKGVMFLALYLIALGSGFIKSNFLAHGADQFDQRIPHQKKMLFNFFNWAYFGLCLGSVVALTLLVWVQDNVGRFWGFGISASAMIISFLALISGNTLYRNKIPNGSPLTRILQVLAAAFRNRKSQLTEEEKRTGFPQQSTKLRFLNKAAFGINGDSNPWHRCSVDQVEESRAFLRILPIFGSTIVMNCAIAQLQTFSVQQGSTMRTSITQDFKVPPASLGAIPLVVLIFLVPLYDLYLIPFARHFTRHPAGIPTLYRTGFGLILSAASMAVAAMVETKRRTNVEKMPITYLLPQFFLSALSEFLTRVGLVEFFYSQSPPEMRSMSVALNSFSVSLGYFMSSLLVSLTNWATRKNNAHSSGGWLAHNDLNEDHLNWFYWLLCGISVVNFFCYVLCALSYTKNSGSTSQLGHQNSRILVEIKDDSLA